MWDKASLFVIFTVIKDRKTESDFNIILRRQLSPEPPILKNIKLFE